MCIKMPSPPPMPPPIKQDPHPTAMNIDATVEGDNEQERRKKLERMRMGLASTVKTSSSGIMDSVTTAKPEALGKMKLGQ